MIKKYYKTTLILPYHGIFLWNYMHKISNLIELNFVFYKKNEPLAK